MRPNPTPSTSGPTPGPITLILRPGQEVRIFVADHTGTVPGTRPEQLLAAMIPSTDSPSYSPQSKPDSPSYSPGSKPDSPSYSPQSKPDLRTR
jgi:hypothetical protein